MSFLSHPAQQSTWPRSSGPELPRDAATATKKRAQAPCGAMWIPDERKMWLLAPVANQLRPAEVTRRPRLPRGGAVEALEEMTGTKLHR